MLIEQIEAGALVAATWALFAAFVVPPAYCRLKVDYIIMAAVAVICLATAKKLFDVYLMVLL